MEERWLTDFIKTISNRKLTLLIAFALIVTLSCFLFFTGHKGKSTPEEGTSPGKIQEIGEIVEEKGSNHNLVEEELPFSLQDSIETIKKAASERNEIKEANQVKRIKVAEKEILLKAMPKLANWKPTPSQYHKGAYGIYETANLSAVYKQAQKGEVLVEIVDYGSAKAALQPLKMIFSMNNSADDYRRYARVTEYNGLKVFEEFNKKTRQIEFSFIVNERYIVRLKSQGKKGTEFLQQFTRAFDFSKLD